MHNPHPLNPTCLCRDSSRCSPCDCQLCAYCSTALTQSHTQTQTNTHMLRPILNGCAGTWNRAPSAALIAREKQRSAAPHPERLSWAAIRQGGRGAWWRGARGLEPRPQGFTPETPGKGRGERRGERQRDELEVGREGTRAHVCGRGIGRVGVGPLKRRFGSCRGKRPCWRHACWRCKR